MFHIQICRRNVLMSKAMRTMRNLSSTKTYGFQSEERKPFTLIERVSR